MPIYTIIVGDTYNARSVLRALSQFLFIHYFVLLSSSVRSLYHGLLGIKNN